MTVLQYSGVCQAPWQNISVGKDGFLALLETKAAPRRDPKRERELSNEQAAVHGHGTIYLAQSE